MIPQRLTALAAAGALLAGGVTLLSPEPARAWLGDRMCYIKKADGTYKYFKRSDGSDLLRKQQACGHFFFTEDGSQYLQGRDVPEQDGRNDTYCGNFTFRFRLDLPSTTHEGTPDICNSMLAPEVDDPELSDTYTVQQLEGLRRKIEDPSDDKGGDKIGDN